MTIKTASPLFHTFALTATMLAGCWLASPAWGTDITDLYNAPPPSNPAPRSKFQQFTEQITERASDLAQSAIGLIGIHYKYGGNSPQTGLDCSGLVRYVFKEALGINLPRTSAELSREGERVDQQDLKPGDLVFYNTLRRSFSHVGIYLGDNKFIHAPRTGAAVRIESMDLAYWKNRFNGARRISDLDPATVANISATQQ
ncbi:C40 family peptidase [Glaciimonas sp. PCH181]|uniref:C40 family peptidase n=1 Tax=Glaciimonas sp. PCH181 TaxID=2133943 RepID=UPI000D391FD1|nr:C40 family peptidase [Glaciimonas sp. PCH181]PUA19255.1 peptidoglycan endopeptidase [Glaciimonas sp. PCH181]